MLNVGFGLKKYCFVALDRIGVKQVARNYSYLKLKEEQLSSLH
jgi:hypothetical protein